VSQQSRRSSGRCMVARGSNCCGPKSDRRGEAVGPTNLCKDGSIVTNLAGDPLLDADHHAATKRTGGPLSSGDSADRAPAFLGHGLGDTRFQKVPLIHGES
jgi:hypothetical protein